MTNQTEAHVAADLAISSLDALLAPLSSKDRLRALGFIQDRLAARIALAPALDRSPLYPADCPPVPFTGY